MTFRYEGGAVVKRSDIFYASGYPNSVWEVKEVLPRALIVRKISTSYEQVVSLNAGEDVKNTNWILMRRKNETGFGKFIKKIENNQKVFDTL